MARSTEVTAAWLRERERGSALGIRLLLVTCRILGRTGARALLYPIVLYYVVFGSKLRRVSRDYLGRLYPRVTFGRVYRHVLRFAQCALDRLFFVRERFELFRVDQHGSHHLLRLEKQRDGALLLGAHLGSFEAMRYLARRESLTVNAVVNFSNARRLNTVLRGIGSNFVDRMIEIDPSDPSFVLEIRERLEKGEMVAILADRVATNERSIRVDFMGGSAPFPTGPFILAAVMKCPVYLTFGIYHPPSRYALYCERFAERVELPRGARDAALVPYVQRFARRLEYYCRLAPENWFNFYDFWTGTAGA